MPKLNEFLFGKKDKIKQTPTVSPEVQQLINMLAGGLMSGQGPFGQFGEYDPQQTSDIFQRGVREPAMRDFRQKLTPQIMQSFADQGASSGLNQTLATSARDLEENLASQESMFQYNTRQQALQNLLAALGLASGARTFEPVVKQGNAGIVAPAIAAFAGGAGQAAGNSWFGG